jgi:hypothetical protein
MAFLIELKFKTNEFQNKQISNLTQFEVIIGLPLV